VSPERRSLALAAAPSPQHRRHLGCQSRRGAVRPARGQTDEPPLLLAAGKTIGEAQRWQQPSTVSEGMGKYRAHHCAGLAAARRGKDGRREAALTSPRQDDNAGARVVSNPPLAAILQGWATCPRPRAGLRRLPPLRTFALRPTLPAGSHSGCKQQRFRERATESLVPSSTLLNKGSTKPTTELILLFITIWKKQVPAAHSSERHSTAINGWPMRRTWSRLYSSGTRSPEPFPASCSLHALLAKTSAAHLCCN